MFGDCVAKLRHCLRFPTFLNRRVSSYLLNLQGNWGVPGLLLSRRVSSYQHPELHLFAILENSTLRLDWILLRQVSLYLTNLFDRVHWGSPGFLTEANSAQSMNLSRQVMSSALTLPRSCFSSSCSCILFAIVLVHPVKLKFREQQVELKWLILNKHNKWFHSSRVKFPLVRMSASWFLVSMYLIWILESKLIRSNNQSRAALWGLDTCVIVGLLPLMIILITASLSSNTYNKASWCEEKTFQGINKINDVQIIDHFSRLLAFVNCARCWTNFTFVLLSSRPVLYGSDACFQERQRSDPTNQEQREYHLTSILHPKKWSLILLNCAKRKFVSYTSNWMEQMHDFQKTHNAPPEVDFESSRSPAKSESWNSPSLHCLAVFPTWQ